MFLLTAVRPYRLLCLRCDGWILHILSAVSDCLAHGWSLSTLIYNLSDPHSSVFGGLRFGGLFCLRPPMGVDNLRD